MEILISVDGNLLVARSSDASSGRFMQPADKITKEESKPGLVQLGKKRKKKKKKWRGGGRRWR